MTLKETIKNRRVEIQRIAERHGAEQIRLFGSVARDEARIDSDVDFLVRFRKHASLLDQAAMIRELEVALGRKVDVVSETGLRDRIRDRVLKEAVQL